MITEKISEYVQKLPSSMQIEVLNFIEFLLSKTISDPVRQETEEWSKFSLATAMRGMEEEDTAYNNADIKVKF